MGIYSIYWVIYGYMGMTGRITINIYTRWGVLPFAIAKLAHVTWYNDGIHGVKQNQLVAGARLVYTPAIWGQMSILRLGSSFMGGWCPSSCEGSTNPRIYRA